MADRAWFGLRHGFRLPHCILDQAENSHGSVERLVRRYLPLYGPQPGTASCPCDRYRPRNSSRLHIASLVTVPISR